MVLNMSFGLFVDSWSGPCLLSVEQHAIGEISYLMFRKLHPGLLRKTRSRTVCVKPALRRIVAICSHHYSPRLHQFADKTKIGA